MAAKDRKRTAVSDLRDLADELGLHVRRCRVDLFASDFTAFHAQVVAACITDAQKRRAADALSQYRTVPLPPLPVAAAPPAGAQPASGADSYAATNASNVGGAADAPGEFRFRTTSCLFTWNNSGFANDASNTLWAAFLLFLRCLSFVDQWTATMERSLKSNNIGRVHLHAFVEFKKAVDWTSLDSMRFQGGLPNASPTRARGDHLRVVKDQGHFYAWAWNEGTLYVETSGYAPW